MSIKRGLAATPHLFLTHRCRSWKLEGNWEGVDISEGRKRRGGPGVMAGASRRKACERRFYKLNFIETNSWLVDTYKWIVNYSVPRFESTESRFQLGRASG